MEEMGEDSLFQKADYFIQVVKGRKNYSVVGIKEYDYDYKIFYDVVLTDIEKARELFNVGLLTPSTFWTIDKELFINFTKKMSLNVKLKKIKRSSLS